MQRSNNACWTCKIRHRKCDEARPECQACNDRHIRCHGYGPKPSWVNNRALVDAELKHIKAVVKQDIARKTRARKSRVNPIDIDNTAPTNQKTTSKPNQHAKTLSFRSNMLFRESQLLIHYLDYIFPLQVPYYVDQAGSGGRGWLFWLLLRNGPLNQAIFTLSALHQSTMSSVQVGGAQEELITYHIKALQRLREALCQFKGDGSFAEDDQVLDFLACGTSLISFEIFRGGTGDWQLHLNALCKVVNNIDLGSSQPWATSQGEADDDHEDRGGKENAQRFFVASVIWFDALACTSTGTAPKISQNNWLTQRGVDMSYLMGCYNWVIIAIGDVATINAQSLSRGSMASTKALDVESRLHAGLREIDSSTKSPEPQALYVSRVFATAALVELYTICPHFYPVRSRIREAVATAIDGIQLVPAHISLRGLTWAICIAGSMADLDQQPFFESTMQKILGSSDSGFGNCDTVLRIMRQCWDHRKKFPGSLWHWRDAMETMGICPLLV